MSYAEPFQASHQRRASSPDETASAERMDQASLRSQLESLHAGSFGWALSCCRRDFHLAEEVVQRTYVKVLSGKAVYREQGEFRTWLFAVIRATARDELRKRWLGDLRWARFARLRTPPEPEPESPPDVDRLAGALAQLPARQRQALELVFYHDMTLAAAAEVMGVTLGSAATHYDRGKKAIKRILEEAASNEHPSRT